MSEDLCRDPPLPPARVGPQLSHDFFTTFFRPCFWNAFFFQLVSSNCSKRVPKCAQINTFRGPFRCFCPSLSQSRKLCFDCAGVSGINVGSSRRTPFSSCFHSILDFCPRHPPGSPFFWILSFWVPKWSPNGYHGGGQRTMFCVTLATLGPR